MGKTKPDKIQLLTYKKQLIHQTTVINEIYDEMIITAQDDQTTLACVTSQGNRIMKTDAIVKAIEKVTETNPMAVKLPPINLPEFDGTLAEFDAFWEQFKACVERDDLAPVDKFNYLKGQLTGNAFKLIAGLPIEGASWDISVKLLESTYGNKKLKIRDLVNQLLNLPAANNNLSSLEKFRAEIEVVLARLQKLGCDIGNSAYLLTAIITKKLPHKAITYIQTREGDDYPDLDPLRSGIQSFIEHLQSHESPVVPNEEQGKRVARGSRLKKVTVNEVHQTPLKPTHKVKASTPPRNSYSCVFCENNHTTDKCDKFKTVIARKKRVLELGRCTLCCGEHAVENCRVRLSRCSQCGAMHHVNFCLKSATAEQRVCTVGETKQPISTALPIGKLSVGGNKRIKKARVLYDQGSQKTFIHSNLVRELGLKNKGTLKLQITGFTGSYEIKEYDIVRVTVKDGHKFFTLEALVLDDLPSNIRVDGNKQCINFLQANKVYLSDSSLGDVVSSVDLLIGADNYAKLVTGMGNFKGVSLLRTRGGHIPYGSIPSRFVTSEVHTQAALVTNVATLPIKEYPDLSNLWRLDLMGIQKEKITQEEQAVVDSFNATVRYDNGQYWVGLPWAPNHPPLPMNYNLAANRLASSLKKLRTRPEHLKLYDQIIKDQVKQNFIEPVIETRVEKNSHYIPHLPVIRESKTTPVRIVYDASAKTKNGVSLNDCLYTGPTLNDKLQDILVRFRTNDYAYTADISKAFLRIGLVEKDRNYTRFLWPTDPLNPESKFDTYRFKSVLFGATSSPFLLQKTVEHHLDSQNQNRELANKLKGEMYCDNIVGTINDETSLLKLYDATNQIMNVANMPLQEWTSNSEWLNEVIGEKGARSDNVLGLKWEYKSDLMSVRTPKYSPVSTKRELLSNISRVYDPLGFVTPLTTPVKILVQDTWARELEWDEALPDDIVKQWEQYSAELKELEIIQFPRMAMREGTEYDLHFFSDASMKAYGTIIFATNYVDSPTFLLSKARVSPLKERSLPQLELTAIWVAAKLNNYVKTTMSHIKINNSYLWTDSEVALQWVKNDNSKLVYVKNRVADIKSLVSATKLMYLPTEDNPADLLTRGITKQKLTNSECWFKGPDWLNSKNDWPEQKFEAEPCVTVVTGNSVPPPPPNIINVERYSKLKKAHRVTSLVFKFLNKISKGKIKISPTHYLIRAVQREAFPEIINFLETVSKAKPPPLVGSLGLFLDGDVIRCSGRIDHANLPYHTRYPLLLPNKHHLVTLLVNDMHDKVMHAGLRDTLCKLRENYWVLRGRQRVKTIINKCVRCKKLEGRPYQYPTPPPLPKERVEDGEPFEVVGVDYTGAIRVGHPTSDNDKAYVVIFTCAATRAVHLELTKDLTAESFLNLFRRFTARRSCPRMIISDNATNFKLGSDLLHHVLEENRVQQELEYLECKWRFIPPRAPWFGGFYERLVGLIKSSLKKVMENKKLDSDELHTLVVEIECRLNNRPLGYTNTDLGELEALTPSHLLMGRRINSIPAIDHSSHQEDPSYLNTIPLSQRYFKISKALKQWHKQWKGEYLTSLVGKMGKRSGSDIINKIKPGDVVLVHTEGNREGWPMAVVQEIFRGKDGVVRTAKVKTRLGSVVRTINKLYPLEIQWDDYENNEGELEETSTLQDGERGANGPPITHTGRQPRAAAESSRSHWRALRDEGNL